MNRLLSHSYLYLVDPFTHPGIISVPSGGERGQ